MKYTLRAESAKEKFERIAPTYTHHYKRTTGGNIEVSFNRGWVTIGYSKLRMQEFEKAIETLKQRPDKSASKIS